jgi:hypothetical protein
LAQKPNLKYKMARFYREKSKIKIYRPTPCKDCGSHDTKRMHRTFLEKTLCILTSGKYAYQKYYCKACDTSTYKSIDKPAIAENPA